MHMVLLTFWLSVAPLSAQMDVEVLVYGGTPGGIIAAVAAAREGADVLLVEPTRHLGGMVSGGLGRTDHGRKETIGGIAREFFERVGQHYGKDIEWYFEPHVAERVFNDLITEAGVRTLFEQTLTSATTNGNRITRITLSNGRSYRAAVFIDATYEGDLMAAAGVPYTVGREAQSQYGESLAGVQDVERASLDAYKSARNYLPLHQWPVPVPGRDRAGGRWSGVVDGPLAQPSTGDAKTQAYNFRLCMTDRPDHRVSIAKPDRYDPARYALLARYLKAWPDVTLGKLVYFGKLPNDKYDVNNNGPFSTDYINASWPYPDANPDERRHIRQAHKDYLQGFFYFLAHDPSVPEKLREETRRWGLAADEFKDNDHWPYQLYVREARRMLGAYVMTQKDVMTEGRQPDTIGMGSFIIDSHQVQRIVGRDGNVINEGCVEVGVPPYAIPYRSLTPRKSDCENLLVPVCLSASHVAWCTLRMEPVFMICGHAAGVAAAMAAPDQHALQEIDTSKLAAKLVQQKQVLDAADPHALDRTKLAGLVIDDTQAELVGQWHNSTWSGPYVGTGYLHDGNGSKGEMSARFTPHLTEAGDYEVRLLYCPAGNRATNVPVTIHAADGTRTVVVNQRIAPADGPFLRLGRYRFDPQAKAAVVIENGGTDGYVVADAVQFVRHSP